VTPEGCKAELRELTVLPWSPWLHLGGLILTRGEKTGGDGKGRQRRGRGGQRRGGSLSFDLGRKKRKVGANVIII